MSYVITQKCVAICDTACVEVCPVDAIHGLLAPDQLQALTPEERQVTLPPMQMFVDPDVCIDCTACEPVCPAEAIYQEDEVSPAFEADIAANEAFFRR